MPVSNASDPPSDSPDPFSSSSDSSDPFSDSNSEVTYPPPPPLAPLSSLLGYTPTDRIRYIKVQSTNTARLLNLQLTPAESAALAYYDSIFYAYESYGDILGTSTGVLAAYLLRNRRPGPFATGLSRVLGQSGNPKITRLISAGFKVAVIGALGRLYGLTSAGVQALNRMRAEQRRDPVMVRVVAARARKVSAMEEETKKKTLGYRVHQQQQGDSDEQSLGGMEIADVKRRSEEAETEAQSREFPFGRPSEKIVEVETQQEPAGEDPFFGRERPKETPVVREGWRNTHSRTTESAWERLRKGKGPSEQEQEQTSPWSARAPMKGFEESGEREPKTDSFSFSNTAEERELAKAQAQKEFDESVEKERRSEAGDGYSEGDKGGRGWRD